MHQRPRAAARQAVQPVREQFLADAGLAELFQNRWVILTPQPRADEAYIEEIARQKHGLLKKNETVYEFKPRARKE